MTAEKQHKVATFPDMRACITGMENMYSNKNAITTYDLKGEGSTKTYRQFIDDVYLVAENLHGMQLSGKHIAIAAPADYNYLVAAYAVLYSGGVVIAIDIELNPDAMGMMAARADAEAVIAKAAYLPAMSESGIKTLISFDDDAPAGAISFSRLFEHTGDGGTHSGVDAYPPVTPENAAVIVYTSGTTNVSKPVLLTHGNIMHNACNSQKIINLGQRMYIPLPLHHTYALVCGVFNGLSQGMHICVSGSLKTVMRDLRTFNPDTVIMVPLMAENVLKAISAEHARHKNAMPSLKRFMLGKLSVCAQGKSLLGWLRRRAAAVVRPIEKDEDTIRVVGDNLKLIISGGAHLPVKVAEGLEGVGISVRQGYGITECSPLVSVNPYNSCRVGSVGKLLPGLKIKFIDGEIWVSGPSVSPGYYKAPELTAEAFRDGWFNTGDIGHIDRGGFLYISGRKKTLVVFSSGKKVSPEQIEAMVSTIPLVKEVVAYGEDSGGDKDDVKLAVMVYPNPALTEGMKSFEILENIQHAVNDLNRKLPMHMRVQIVKIKDAPFDKTASLKIKR